MHGHAWATQGEYIKAVKEKAHKKGNEMPLVSWSLSNVSDEIALLIGKHLPAEALCLLLLTCKRFSEKYVTVVRPVGSTASPEKAGAWSIVDEIARRRLDECHEGERAWVPRRGDERWLGLMFEVEALRVASKCFTRLSNDQLRLTDDGAKVTWPNHHGPNHHWLAEALPVATTTANMRAGKHFAQITVTATAPLYFGVVRSTWHNEQGADALNQQGHCFYFTHTGHRTSDGHPQEHWEGMQRARRGDRIGLLLDCDEGTVTVFRNGTKLGKIDEGLDSEYNWAVALHSNASARIDAVSVEHALEEAQYREILHQMRPYKDFGQSYANGALRNWQEESEERLRQVDTPLNGEERERYAKHVRIANRLRTMFARMRVLLEENSQEYKSDFSLVEVRKMKATLDKVIERCRGD